MVREEGRWPPWLATLTYPQGALVWKAGRRPVVGWHWQEPTHTCLLPPWRPGLLRLNHLGRSGSLVIKSELPSA